MHCIAHNDHTNRFSVRLDLPTASFSYKTHSSSTLLINTKSSLSLTLWPYNLVGSTDLCSIEGGFASPLEHVLINIPIVSSQDRIQLLVVDVKGIRQGHSVGPQLSKQLLDSTRNLHHLGHTQQSGLEKEFEKKNKTKPTTPAAVEIWILDQTKLSSRKSLETALLYLSADHTHMMILLTCRKSPEFFVMPYRV